MVVAPSTSSSIMLLSLLVLLVLLIFLPSASPLLLPRRTMLELPIAGFLAYYCPDESTISPLRGSITYPPLPSPLIDTSTPSVVIMMDSYKLKGLKIKTSSTDFTRADEHPDDQFYEVPVYSSSFSKPESESLKSLYNLKISKNDSILDLCSSNTPRFPLFLHVEGWGMNKFELSKNPTLKSYSVVDFNSKDSSGFLTPIKIPKTYDVITLNNGLEYITRPSLLISSISKALKKGGTLIVTFNERFYPSKVCNLWLRLKEEEKGEWIGGVMEKEGFEVEGWRGGGVWGVVGVKK